MSWRAHSADPNSTTAVAVRRTELARVERRVIADRGDWLIDFCRGRRVLDLGCVDHEVSTFEQPVWLHGRIVEVAASCVGLDIEPEGVEALRARGFDAHVLDITEPGAAAQAGGPFDVVVAGEIIEHLSNPGALFAFAAGVLAPDGVFLVTTPNPWAPWRVALGRAAVTWENVDHVALMFPSGIAELADRFGFVLEEHSVTSFPRSARSLVRSVLVTVAVALQRLRGKRSDSGRGRLGWPFAYWYASPPELLLARYQHGADALGETSLYRLRLGTPGENAAGRRGAA